MSNALSAVGLLGLVALAACTAKTPEAKPSPSAAGGLANGSFTAELNGFRIHYEVHGQGPVLMALTNSWGLSLEALRALAWVMAGHPRHHLKILQERYAVS